jgi:hypothetical protein
MSEVVVGAPPKRSVFVDKNASRRGPRKIGLSIPGLTPRVISAHQCGDLAANRWVIRISAGGTACPTWMLSLGRFSGASRSVRRKSVLRNASLRGAPSCEARGWLSERNNERKPSGWSSVPPERRCDNSRRRPVNRDSFGLASYNGWRLQSLDCTIHRTVRQRRHSSYSDWEQRNCGCTIHRIAQPLRGSMKRVEIRPNARSFRRIARLITRHRSVRSRSGSLPCDSDMRRLADDLDYAPTRCVRQSLRLRQSLRSRSDQRRDCSGTTRERASSIPSPSRRSSSILKTARRSARLD